MARKKKSKKKSESKKAKAAEAKASGDASTSKAKSDKKSQPTQKSKAKKKATPKKTGSRRKAARKGSEAEDSTGTDPVAEERPDAVVDADDGDPEDAERLLAALAELEDEGRQDSEPAADGGEGPTAEAEHTPAPDEAAATLDDDEEPVEDLDAILDDDEDSADLDALIAAAVAGADPEDQPAEPAVVALDGEPAETVSSDGAPPPRYSEAEDAAAEAADASGRRVESDTAAVEETTSVPSAPASFDDLPPSAEEYLEGAIDLGDVSSPEVRDRLLAQALAHAEMQDARYRVPFSDPLRAGRWKGTTAVFLFLAAAVIAVAPPSWVRPEPPAEIGAAQRSLGIRRALVLQAQQVDAYRVRAQRLPDSLDELSGALPAIRYVRSGNRAFQLIAYEPDGNPVVYDSSNPAPEFEATTDSWARTIGP